MAAEWTRRWQQHGIDAEEHSQRLREITCCCLGPPILFGEAEKFAECKNCNIGFNPQTMFIETRGGHPCRKIEKICQKARSYRFDTTKLSELEKASRKLKDAFAGLEKLRDIRQTVLYIIEYGMAWVHMEKNLSDRALIKANLSQLLRQYEELLMFRSNFNDSVESLNSSVQKAIEMIKRHV
ncbi:hypothetical protein ANCDUO_03643 [Ancylostoma duodenale]|uniref:Uncharacterized protein n=1 Tax=Ancylostoma duodenale TaxID=51022 RepID=A0A0C2D8I4_9BILA|nr:hypothetical protein ANCDUO_03643 [Ancylostoma duodenale]